MVEPVTDAVDYFYSSARFYEDRKTDPGFLRSIGQAFAKPLRLRAIRYSNYKTVGYCLYHSEFITSTMPIIIKPRQAYLKKDRSLIL